MAWKRTAQAGRLMVREYESPVGADVTLDWAELGPLEAEARIRRLARWVVDAERESLRSTLILPRHTPWPGQRPGPCACLPAGAGAIAMSALASRSASVLPKPRSSAPAPVLEQHVFLWCAASIFAALLPLAQSLAPWFVLLVFRHRAGRHRIRLAPADPLRLGTAAAHALRGRRGPSTPMTFASGRDTGGRAAGGDAGAQAARTSPPRAMYAAC
ncbi:MAG: DUF58 domain-containing protein [Chiayiivirga sp.]|nr:DUF58 domain-containing protein [Chiayiivirga sp.]